MKRVTYLKTYKTGKPHIPMEIKRKIYYKLVRRKSFDLRKPRLALSLPETKQNKTKKKSRHPNSLGTNYHLDPPKKLLNRQPRHFSCPNLT